MSRSSARADAPRGRLAPVYSHAARRAAVVEARLAVERHLHLAVHAADQAHQHVVGVVVGRRAAVGVGALVLVVPGADQQHVAHDDPAAARAPARLEHVRAGQVAARRRHLDVGRAPAGTCRRRGRASRRTRSASRSAAGRATRCSSSAPPARTSRSPTGSRTRRSAGTGWRRSPPSPTHLLTGGVPPPRRAARSPPPRPARPAPSGRRRPEKARATASALSSPVTRNTIRREPFTTGSVRVMRDTSGAIPGVSTPTTGRSRSPSASSPGNSEQVWASGPSPSRIRSKSGSPAASYSRS